MPAFMSRRTPGINPADYARHMDVNYMGVVNALPGLIDSMLTKRTGQIAIVSSAAGGRACRGGSLSAANRR